MRNIAPARPRSRHTWPLAAFALAPLATAAGEPAVRRLDHIVVIVMENHSYDQVRVLPYTASLMASGSYCSNSYGITHPSQPNYIALWSGDMQGVTSNRCPAPGSPFMVENLGHACETAGLTWRAYSENLPAVASTVCTASRGLYTAKHAPWMHFGNLNHQNERPLTDLAVDIANNSLANLTFIVPNNCNNTHDCTLAVGDTWLSQTIPPLLAAVGPNGCVILTWDEDDDRSSNHILTVFAGATVKTGFVAAETVDHYNVLRTICDGLGLTPFGAAATATAIADIWVPTTAVPATAWGRVKSLYR